LDRLRGAVAVLVVNTAAIFTRKPWATASRTPRASARLLPTDFVGQEVIVRTLIADLTGYGQVKTLLSDDSTRLIVVNADCKS
jgi:hypothetical protein